VRSEDPDDDYVLALAVEFDTRRRGSNRLRRAGER
jgi:hypothetical protein